MPAKTFTFLEFLKTFGITLCTIIAGYIANDAHALMKSMEELKIEQTKLQSELTWHQKLDEVEFEQMRKLINNSTQRLTDNKNLAEK
jgi:hypothetical protein